MQKFIQVHTDRLLSIINQYDMCAYKINITFQEQNTTDNNKQFYTTFENLIEKNNNTLLKEVSLLKNLTDIKAFDEQLANIIIKRYKYKRSLKTQESFKIYLIQSHCDIENIDNAIIILLHKSLIARQKYLVSEMFAILRLTRENFFIYQQTNELLRSLYYIIKNHKEIKLLEPEIQSLSNINGLKEFKAQLIKIINQFKLYNNSKQLQEYYDNCRNIIHQQIATTTSERTINSQIVTPDAIQCNTQLKIPQEILDVIYVCLSKVDTILLNSMQIHEKAKELTQMICDLLTNNIQKIANNQKFDTSTQKILINFLTKYKSSLQFKITKLAREDVNDMKQFQKKLSYLIGKQRHYVKLLKTTKGFQQDLQSKLNLNLKEIDNNIIYILNREITDCQERCLYIFDNYHNVVKKDNMSAKHLLYNPFF